MARQILPIAGQVIGSMVGGPFGAFVGGAIGTWLGGVVDPMRLQGPKLGEARTQTAQEGVYRPIVLGTGCVAGNVIHRSPRVVRIHSEDVGKGSNDTIETERGYRTYAIRIAEGPLAGLLRIWENETLVYDVRPESEISAESFEFAKKFRFYRGDEEQLPDPALEAYMGVGNVSSYRGTAYIVFEDIDLTDLHDMVPQYRFEVTSAAATIEVGDRITNQYVMNSHNSTAYIIPTTGGGLMYTASASPLVVGQSYEIGRLSAHLDHESSSYVNVSPIDIGPGYLQIRGLSPSGLGVSSDGSGGYCRPISSGQVMGTLTPSDEPPGSSWWFGEEQYDPEYGGLVWIRGGSVFIGVRRTGGAVGGFRHRLIKFPLISGIDVPEDAMVLGIGDDVSQRFWMTMDRQGLIHILQVDGEYRVFNQGLSEIGGGSPPIDTSGVLGIGVDSGVMCIIFNDRAEFRDISNWSIIRTIEDGRFGSGAIPPTRVVFTDDACFVQRGVNILRVDWMASGKLDPEKISLSSIVAWCHRRVGAGPVDVSALTDPVDGVVFADGYSARDAITSILPIYNADAVECDMGSDYRINYVKRGGPVVRTLTFDDLVDEPEETVREDHYERPRKMHMAFQNPIIGYAAAKATAERISPDAHVVGEQSYSVPVTFADVDEAWQRNDVQMRIAWTEAEGKRKLSLSDEHLDLVPTDNVAIAMRGRVQRVRLLKDEYADGVMNLETIADRQSNYTSNVTGIPLPEPTAPPPSIVGPTDFAVLDIPALSDNHDRLLYYVAASGETEAWQGAVVQRQDAGEFATIATFTRSNRSVMGVLETEVSAASPHYTDTTNEVTVRLHFEGDELHSLSDQQFLSEGGAFALETTAGWEVMQYRDAEQLDERTYRLTHLARGRLNTDAGAHAIGSKFVLLNRVQPVNATTAMLDQPITHRAVSVGRSPEGAPTNTITYQGLSQVEFPIADIVTDGIIGGEITIRIVPRHRFGTEDHPVRSVNWTGYRIEASIAVASQTVNTTSDTHTFTVPGPASGISITVGQVNRFTGQGETTTEVYLK